MLQFINQRKLKRKQLPQIKYKGASNFKRTIGEKERQKDLMVNVHEIMFAKANKQQSKFDPRDKKGPVCN